MLSEETPQTASYKDVGELNDNTSFTFSFSSFFDFSNRGKKRETNIRLHTTIRRRYRKTKLYCQEKIYNNNREKKIEQNYFPTIEFADTDFSCSTHPSFPTYIFPPSFSYTYIFPDKKDLQDTIFPNNNGGYISVKREDATKIQTKLWGWG